jgi:hypothetical protein
LKPEDKERNLVGVCLNVILSLNVISFKGQKTVKQTPTRFLSLSSGFKCDQFSFKTVSGSSPANYSCGQCGAGPPCLLKCCL